MGTPTRTLKRDRNRPGLDIRSIPISKINPAPYNPRKDLRPGDPEYLALQRSIESFGCVEPLVWNHRTGNLVGGHQRFKVLVERGATHIDVSIVDLAPEQEKALNLALNKVQGDWDQHKLAALLDELCAVPEFDLAVTGFEWDEARDIIAEILGDSDGPKPEEFDVEQALKEAGPAVTKPGDLIELGIDPRISHRLLCGDSGDPEQVRRLMNGERAVLFATDPPYLVGYDGTNHPGAKGKFREKQSGSTRASRGQGINEPKRSVLRPDRDALRPRACAADSTQNKDWSDTYGVSWDDADENSDLYERFIAAAVSEAVLPNAAWYCWHASRRQAALEREWEKAGAFVHCQIIWVKNRGVLTRTWYMWRHEPCFFGWLKGRMPPRASDQHLPTVWQVDTLPNGADRPDHPTPKPLELFEIPMRQHTRGALGSKPADVCYEPFAGSGTQFIAGQRLGRRCFGLEISPIYCDLIVRRFIAYAGEGAVKPEVAKKYRVPTKKGGGR